MTWWFAFTCTLPICHWESLVCCTWGTCTASWWRAPPWTRWTPPGRSQRCPRRACWRQTTRSCTIPPPGMGAIESHRGQGRDSERHFLRLSLAFPGSLSGSLWLSLVPSLALSGSLVGSLWLSLFGSLFSSLWLSFWLSLALFLALSGFFWSRYFLLMLHFCCKYVKLCHFVSQIVAKLNIQHFYVKILDYCDGSWSCIF